MKTFGTILLAAVTLSLGACGGRATLDDHSGRSYQMLWQAQAQSRPSPALADMSAADVKTAMGNHVARYRVGGDSDGSSSHGGSGSGGNRGLLTPSTSDFGEGMDPGGSGGGGRGIRLEAR